MVGSGLITHFFVILSYILAIVGIAHMLRHRRSPGSTMAWLLLFIGLPFVGTALYLMFGGRKLKRHRRDAHRKFDIRNAVPREHAGEFDLTLRSYGAPPATTGNRITFCKNGVEGYEHLVELIDQAQHRIHLATFIFSTDDVGSDILNRLASRASQGIDVKVLVDGVGSIKTPHRFFRPLVEAGGRYSVFQPAVHLPFRTRTNLRNHRKIVVVDGRRSFSGGMNIVREGIHRAPVSEGWHDMALGIDGPAAEHLDAIFLADWKFATREPAAEDITGQAAMIDDSEIPGGHDVVQVLASGPDVPDDPMYSSSLTAIFRANQRVWIVTPYFVPNDTLVESLVFACQRGIDVRILIPATSNHPITDLAGATLLREIRAAGGKIYRCSNGMMHAKAMIVDHEYAAVGSANFDMRSLFLNYEVMQICYSKSIIDAVSAWFLELAADSTSEFRKPGLLRELSEGAVRALSPMF